MPFATLLESRKPASPAPTITALFTWPDASSSLHDSMKLGIPSMYADAMAEAVQESDDGASSSAGNW
jgi:hypothetical protein